MTKYYVDENGAYIGAFDGAVPSNDSIEIPSPPADARQKWDGEKFLPYINYYEQMSNLEATRTQRREREARLGIAGAQEWLDNLDSQIEALRP